MMSYTVYKPARWRRYQVILHRGDQSVVTFRSWSLDKTLASAESLMLELARIYKHV